MELEEFLKIDLKKKFKKNKKEASLEAGKSTDKKESRKLYSIRDCFEIQEILRRPDTYLGKHLKEPCPECGEKTVYCGHKDLGGVDYYDNFWHLCLNCLYSLHSERYTGIGQESEYDTICPFCSHK